MEKDVKHNETEEIFQTKACPQETFSSAAVCTMQADQIDGEADSPTDPPLTLTDTPPTKPSPDPVGLDVSIVDSESECIEVKNVFTCMFASGQSVCLLFARQEAKDSDKVAPDVQRRLLHGNHYAVRCRHPISSKKDHG